MELVTDYPVEAKANIRKNIIIWSSRVIKATTWFFDGVTAISLGGKHYFYILLGCISSTNTWFELLALWGLLFVADKMSLHKMSVFGDSKTIID